MSAVQVFQCSTCEKVFSTKGNLSQHLKSAKYCLQRQGKDVPKNFVCAFCQKCFTTKQSQFDHMQQCTHRTLQSQITEMQREHSMELHTKDMQLQALTDKYHTEITCLNDKHATETKCLNARLEEVSKQLAEAQKIIANMAQRATTINNNSSTTNNTNSHNHNSNNVNRVLVLSAERVNSVLDNRLTGDVAAIGQRGLAQMLHKRLLTDDDGNSLYVCTDASRQVFEYVNEDGEIERDVKANKLQKTLVESNVGGKALNAFDRDFRENQPEKYNQLMYVAMEIKTIENDSSKFRSELARITSP